MRSKRGQVMLFIIVALVIVALAIFFFFIRKPGKSKPSEALNPEAYLQDCINLELEPAVEKLASQGGYLEEPTLYQSYMGYKVAYLCYTNKKYERCVIQHPSPLQNFIEKQLNQKIGPFVTDCINNFKRVANQKGYDVSICSSDQLNFSVSIIKGEIIVPIECSITLKKGEEVKKFENVEPFLKWPLYEELLIVNEIINWEILYGDFPVSLHPQGKFVTKDFREDGNTEIYNVTIEGKSFLFAIRNFPM